MNALCPSHGALCFRWPLAAAPGARSWNIWNRYRGAQPHPSHPHTTGVPFHTFTKPVVAAPCPDLSQPRKSIKHKHSSQEMHSC
ncbi:hypothetical protein SKAU_G00073250 [Synaphobranchus kaupii]|uniref:Uncharacterized protein n=1 Tax=Synaphobranchus kaupii TaxID=118154 RepID=A0A9Q1G8T0_SYNKA|nr:hypothetical protein SKAU_G00073250 [Synaphobranchus kaupii]